MVPVLRPVWPDTWPDQPGGATDPRRLLLPADRRSLPDWPKHEVRGRRPEQVEPQQRKRVQHRHTGSDIRKVKHHRDKFVATGTGERIAVMNAVSCGLPELSATDHRFHVRDDR